MKLLPAIITLIILGCLIVPAVHAETYPKLTGYVNDFAGVMTPQEAASLSAHISQIEKNTSVEIAILTIQSTNGQDRTMYAAKTGDENGVGKKATDNGVVVLWSMDNTKGGAIATGRGIESTLTDLKVTRIGKASRQYFDQGQYYNGFEYILTNIEAELNPPATSVSEPLTGDPIVATMVAVIVVVFSILVIAAIASMITQKPEEIHSYSGDTYKSSHSRYRKHHDDDDDDDFGTAILAGSIAGSSYSHDDSSSHDSGSSFGGGFGGFGGGRFGGGGGSF